MVIYGWPLSTQSYFRVGSKDMSDVFTLPRLGGGHVSKHFGIGGVTHNATDVTDFVGRNQFLKIEVGGVN